ncbi:ABC transporter ATP-binding protein [Haloplanus aerogenes]|uniref:ABC transporter ATP-binding protein n=1 Tax=Haloplanus aerogenes TaxID=660522 RepID=A0A3M0E809_9EURY|nr:ABC transporter ATP-binding protein [Haloplanus aerogenes]AZH24343.1 ABC transporter ATP-binding protein [Haloplanus aerogenes]RMB24023.1 putative ABC transport system ATP-binding protein [Haloplanus aerogenes]
MTERDAAPSADPSVPPNSNPVAELDSVTKQYRSGDEVINALDDVDFAVEPGEMVAVMGPSGSGKSTLLNVLGLLDVPTSGTVYLDGDDVTDYDDERRTMARRRTIGFVFQSFHLVPMLTATENVLVPTMFVRGNHRERAEDLLRRMGLGDRLDHRPDQLSGGQRQRVAIARALVNEPRLVLADEPTGNLDQDTGRQILEEFERISTERDVGVVAVTHDDLVTEFTDRTVELIDGVVQ